MPSQGARQGRVRVDGVEEIEIGFHVRASLQGRGLATEAPAACRDFARDTVKTDRLIAIIDPANTPSQRVAEKLGLSVEKRTTSWGTDEREQLIFAMALRSILTSTVPSHAAGRAVAATTAQLRDAFLPRLMSAIVRRSTGCDPDFCWAAASVADARAVEREGCSRFNGTPDHDDRASMG